MDTTKTEFQPLKDLLTVEQAAEALSCTPTRVRQMIAEGNKFRVVKTFGARGYLLPQGEVTRLARTLERQRAKRFSPA